MIVDVGIGEIITDMVDLITQGVVSTDSATPDASDTTVPGEISATELALTDITATNKTITCKHLINSTLGNGSTFRKDLIKTAAGTLFSEDSHPDLVKTSSDEVAYFHKITLDRG